MDETKKQKIAQYNSKQQQQQQTTTKEETKQQTNNEDAIKKKAEETKEQKRVEQLQKDIAEKKRQEEIEKKQVLEKTSEHLKDIQESAVNTISPFVAWLGRQPTPGGVATLGVVLIFFLFVMVPVNTQGDTRLKLLWFTLTGKTHLAYSTGTDVTDTIQTPQVNNSVPSPVTSVPIPNAINGQNTVQDSALFPSTQDFLNSFFS